MAEYQDRNRAPQRRGPQDHKQLDAKGLEIVNAFNPAWITSGFDKACSRNADAFAEYLVHGQITRTQVRNFFGELRRIEARGAQNSSEQIRHLHHKLCYTKARLEEQGKDRTTTNLFQQVLEKGLQAIPDAPEPIEAPFARFVAYFEAVLAYHRFHGGKEK